jgi:hypothetical protein
MRACLIIIPVCGVPEAVHHIQSHAVCGMRHKKDDMDLFAEETDTDAGSVKPLSFEQYQKLIAQ